MNVVAMTRSKAKSTLRPIFAFFTRLKYPHLRITEPPESRPSVASVHYLVNQLGAHSPVGLTHRRSTAYHELPFPNLRLMTSRNDLSLRVSRITENLAVESKYGLDIGCAVGGVSFALQAAGARMVGIDRDLPSINVAAECEALYNTGARFLHSEFCLKNLAGILSTAADPVSKEVDFAVWFSSFNWVAKELGGSETKNVLAQLSSSSRVLVADSAIGGKGQAAMSSLGIDSNQDFSSFVLNNSNYSKVRKIGTDKSWYGRDIFLFER